MRSNAEARTRWGWRLYITAIAAVWITACSKPANPASPDVNRSVVGTWTGTIASDVIGRGSATVVIDFEINSATVPLWSGTFSFDFPEQTFDARGLVSGVVSSGRTAVSLTFDRSPVPCPAESQGVAQKALVANTTLSNNRLHGAYIVGGCPGGTLDLVRQQ